MTTSKLPKLTKTDLESKFQKDVIKFLKQHKCFVMKITPMPGIPDGTSDVFFCKEGLYGFIECKKSKNAKSRPGQDEFVKKMDEWSFGRKAYPENWDEVQKELEELLK